MVFASENKVMKGGAHIVDVVLDVGGICRTPAGVGGGGQVLRGVLPQGLLASRNTGARVEGPRVVGCIVGVPQQVDVKGVLQGEARKQT